MKFGHLEGVPQPYFGDFLTINHGYSPLTSHGMILHICSKWSKAKGFAKAGFNSVCTSTWYTNGPTRIWGLIWELGSSPTFLDTSLASCHLHHLRWRRVIHPKMDQDSPQPFERKKHKDNKMFNMWKTLPPIVEAPFKYCAIFHLDSMIMGERIPVSVLCQGILGGSIGVTSTPPSLPVIPPEVRCLIGMFWGVQSYHLASVPYNGLING